MTAFGGHPRTVRAVAFSPDCARLRTAGDDGTVRVWSTVSGELISSEHTGGPPGLGFGWGGDRWRVERGAVVGPDAVIPVPAPITAVAADPELAVGLADGRVLRLVDHALDPVAEHSGAVTAIAATAALVVSACADGVVRVWNARTGSVTAQLEADVPIRSAALVGDGCLLVDADGGLWSWDFGPRRVERATGFGPVQLVVAGSSGLVAYAHESGPVVLHDGSRDTAVLPGHGGVLALAVHGGLLLSGGADHTVRAWSLATGAPAGVRVGPKGAIRAVRGDRACDEFGALWRWDGAAGRVEQPGRGPVGAAAFAPDGILVAGGVDGRLTIGRDRVASPHDGWVRAIDADADLVVAGSDDGVLVLLPRRAGAPVTHQLGSPVHAVALAPRGRVLAGCADGSVRLFDAQSELTAHTGHTTAVRAVVWLPGGGVAAGAEDGGIRVWRPGKPADPVLLEGHADVVRALVVTPDGRLISGGDDGTVRIWDLAEGRQVAGTGFTAPPVARPRPGVVNDVASAEDLLGVTQDVDALAALIADRATDPPLAIALLGRWGSGKSSFLRQVEARVRTLAAESHGNPEDGVYTATVRQIRFNAWQYSDDHLWVGLVEHLFRGLGVEEGPPEDAAALRERSQALGAELERADGGAADGLRVPALLRLLWRERTMFRGRWGAVAAVLAASVAGAAAWALWGGPLVAAVVAAVAFAAPVGQALASGYQAFRAFPGTLREKVSARKQSIDARLAADPVTRVRELVEQVRAGRFAAHRGVLGAVAGDLRGLSDDVQAALAEWRRTEHPAAGPPPLERVVLYIDDLDRCPPQRVVDVLAAVHLLLALPVFVVVVAIDPAWLRRALREEPGYPLDYLDKIFQLAFALRPMGTGADRLIDTLLPDLGGELPVASAGPARRPAAPVSRPGAAPRAGTPRQAAVAARERRPRPDQLRTRAAERDFVKRVRPLLPTPRAVKRLVNTYRLIRAGIPPEHVDRFVRPDGTGPYQAVIVLLAITVAEPHLARERLTSIAAAEEGQRIADVLGLAPAAADVADLGTLAEYRRWAGTVARFGFDTTDLVDSDHSPFAE